MAKTKKVVPKKSASGKGKAAGKNVAKGKKVKEVSGVRSLSSDEDVALTERTGEQRQGSYIKLNEGQTPLIVLSDEYREGYVHWVDDEEDKRTPTGCAGGLEYEGMAADVCPACATAREYYKLAKQWKRRGAKDKAERLHEMGKDLGAGYRVDFIVAVGRMRATGAKSDKGKRIFVPDMNDADVGILSFSKNQKSALFHMWNSGDYPFMRGGRDLIGRIIVADKRKRGNDDYATIEFIPTRKTVDVESYPYDKEELDLSTPFIVNMALLKESSKVTMPSKQNRSGSEVEFEEGEGEVAKENDEDSILDDAEAMDDAAFDDEGLDDAGVVEDDFLGDDFDDDFETDMTDGEGTEESDSGKKKSVAKKSSTKKSTSKPKSGKGEKSMGRPKGSKNSKPSAAASKKAEAKKPAAKKPTAKKSTGRKAKGDI